MKKKKQKLMPFVPLRIDMLMSLEWRRLSNKAKVIYIYMRKNSYGEIKRIKIPYSCLIDMMSSQTISNGLKELQKAGFIEQISKGGMYGSPAIYDFIGPFANPFESGRHR